MVTFKRMRNWEKVRAKGKRRFLLVNGILVPVLAFALIAVLNIILWPGNLFMPDPSRNETPKVIILLPMLLAGIASSYYWMRKIWDFNEKTDEAALEDKSKSEENIPPQG